MSTVLHMMAGKLGISSVQHLFRLGTTSHTSCVVYSTTCSRHSGLALVNSQPGHFLFLQTRVVAFSSPAVRFVFALKRLTVF